jgi:hypothetical protein
MPRRNYRVGDVFKFKIDEDRHGYGQIVAAPPHDLKYFAIFDLATGEEMDLGMIVSSKILILAQSMDVKLDIGDWQIIGNAPVTRQNLVFPEYKVHYIPNGWMVESYDGKILRPATKDDVLKLKMKKSFSPAALEYAIKAHLGLVEYKEFCDELMVRE